MADTKQHQLALVKKDTVDVVAEKVRMFQEDGQLNFPANYSPENAMKSAWLTLQATKDKDGKPALETCTRDSIANSLLDMVVQGLTPAKDQGYFIAYGKELTFQRSYFGTMAVCKRVTGAKDILAQVVYEGDEFEYYLDKGRVVISKHVQKLGSIGKKIVAAYCIVEFGGDTPDFVGLMTMDEIQKAWNMSKMKSNSTRDNFPQEMAKRTVINRTCKTLINSSDDSSLVIEHFRNSDATARQAAVEAEVAEHANQEPIDVEAYEAEDVTADDPQAKKTEPPSDNDWADDAPPF